MNTNLSYAPNAVKVGFADIENVQFADTTNLTVEQQKDIFFTAANRCRGSFIPTWANEPQFFPSSVPPIICNNGGGETVTIELTDLNGNPVQAISTSTQVVGKNVQDLTTPPNKMTGLNISKKDILIFVMVGAGIFVISKIFS